MRAVNFTDHEKLRRIQNDALIIWGSQDTWLPSSLGRQFDRVMPSSHLVLLDSVGHNFPEEADSYHLAQTRLSWTDKSAPIGKKPNTKDCVTEISK